MVYLVYKSSSIQISMRNIHVIEHPKLVQEHYLEETFKMRNLLEELDDSRNYGLRKPTILGVREHVFTGRCNLISHLFVNFYLEAKHCFHVLIGGTCSQAILKQFMIEVGRLVFLNISGVFPCQSFRLQCFFFGLVHVTARAELRNTWTKGTCKASQVSILKL